MQPSPYNCAIVAMTRLVRGVLSPIGMRKISSSQIRHRTPLIKFIGKRSLLPNKSQINLSPPTKELDKALKFSTGHGLNFYDLEAGAWHGVPRISELELEAVLSGGATCCE